VSVILQNCYYGDEVIDEHVELSLVVGDVIASAEISLPPRHSRVIDLDETFNGAFSNASTSVAIRATGRYLNHPFTFVNHVNGDFSIHHF